MTSPELTGGAGFTYEDAVAAKYLAAMLAGTTGPALDAGVVLRVAQQQADFGEPLDDVIVDASALADGTSMRLSLQVKRSLTVSAAATNADFREVIQRSWATLQKSDFREHVDRVGAAVGTISEDTFRALTAVCEWARASDATEGFMKRFGDGGNASAAHSAVAEAIRSIAQVSAVPLSDQQLHRLLAHFVLVRFDFLHAGSTDDADAIAGLQRALVASQAPRAGDLWDVLRQMARDGAGRSAVHTRATLIRALTSWRFNGAPALAGDMQILREAARHWVDQQADDIGGARLPRQGLRDVLRTQIGAHRLTLIKGLPGTGKTVLLRSLIQELAADGTTLVMTANRLSGRSWSEHARAIGLTTTSIESLLVEVAATGHTTVFIDGLDRIAPEQRAIMTDLLGQLLTNPALADWRVVATARDTGIEPLRNWVPSALLAGSGVGYVDVENLTHEEANSLADSLPALRPLLIGGNERVRTLARRPFFAAVLAQGLSRAAYPTDFAPQSEVDLVEAWWTRGGHDAEAPQALARQRGLIEFAQSGAPDLGRNVRIRDLSAATQQVLPALESDGLVQQIRAGHTAQFSHDIFFEWAFFHLLLDQGDDWIAALSAAGEPPALARVVELLSQATYPNSEEWQRELRAVESAALRPQWLRAWLVAPVFSPIFEEHAEMFTEALAGNDYRLFGKLLVWMRAEKTTPNPMVLSGVIGGDLDAAARIRVADTLGWPSDFAAWRRVLLWAIEQADLVPDDHIRDLVALFETWQIACADYANPVSQRILAQCATWLNAIDDEHADRRRWYVRKEDAAEPRLRAPNQVESELRALLLRSARAYPDVVGAYLTRVEKLARWPDEAYRELMLYAPILSGTHSAQLVRISRGWFMDELPDDKSARWRREAEEEGRRRQEARAVPPEQRTKLQELALASSSIMHHSFSNHDWDDLAINGDHQGFFPASPLREPFHSLLAADTAGGLALIRDVTNHAVTAWRQMHRHWRGQATPLPLVLTFPWGNQEFWGSDRHYFWFRGHGGPQVVECALMTLERWAIAQLDAGRPLDEVLREVLDGHTSIGVLGIAVHLALRAKSVTPTTLALLSSLRLWRIDMQRFVQERQLQEAGLMGFDGGNAGGAHRDAVAESGKIASRRLELRDLVPYFVLGGDAELKAACRAALDAFPNNLEFAYEGEEVDADHVAELRRTAELWAELGHAENYTATPIPGRDDIVQISMSSPKHEAPEVKAAQQKHALVARESALWLWVQKCFESRAWSPEFSVDAAVERAKELAGGWAAGQAISLLPGSGLTEGAIVGTAAAVICYGGSTEHRAWADAVIEDSRTQADAAFDDAFALSVIPWHPKIFVAHAVADRIRLGQEQPADRDTLYSHIAHPLNVVSSVALAGVAACWPRDPGFSWCGLNLGFRLSQYTSRRDLYLLDSDSRQQMEFERRAAALTASIEEFKSDGPLPAWVIPRPSWAQAAPRDVGVEELDVLDEEDEDGSWLSTDELWDGRFAALVLRHAPVAAIMSSSARSRFVESLEAFVAWTLDTINPAWRAEQRRGRERGQRDLYEWEDQLGRALAGAAQHLAGSETVDRLLRPILTQPDDIAMRFLAPFAVSVVCAEVLDAQEIREDTLIVLMAVLERTLESRDLRRTPYNDGRIGGFHLPKLVDAMLLVVVEHAGGATRFANGVWTDLNRVMPLLDRFLREAGWNPYVANQFVTLCERAGGAYDAQAFAEQVLAQVIDGALPAGWKGTTVPARIAALVQAHADRQHPLPPALARKLLAVLDGLVDLGDRRSAALQQSESFRGVRLQGA